MLPPPGRGKAAAWLVLAAAAAITVAAWHLARMDIERRNAEHFQVRTGSIRDAIDQHLRAYQQILRGGAGLFDAIQQVTREDWRAYVQRLQLEANYPGIQGLGFSLWIAPEALDEHIRRIRAEGFPDYSPWPEGERRDYTAILYLEPFDWRNRRAFGYDMFSEPVRRAAMEKARDSGAVAVSGKVTLVQETEEDVQAGFLMYLAVYRPMQPPDPAALLGYVFG
ncbi:MAG: CHASE domain-containing protein, partial [Pseudomonadota bacterium]|nr:CHASE domain-containing protein [Pseudomonadota bacterium]